MRQSTQLCRGCFCNLRVPAQKHAEKYPFSHHREIQLWKFLPYQGADAKFLQRWKVGEENYSRVPKSKQTACTWKCPWAAKSWEADKSPQRCTTVPALITILRGGFPLLKTDCGPARIFSRGFPRCMLQPAANLNSTAPISWPSAVSCRCRLFPMSGSTVHQTVKTTWMHRSTPTLFTEISAASPGLLTAVLIKGLSCINPRTLRSQGHPCAQPVTRQVCATRMPRKWECWLPPPFQTPSAGAPLGPTSASLWQSGQAEFLPPQRTKSLYWLRPEK